MTDLSFAPWTDEEVRSLNTYQAAGVMHPFTCGDDHDAQRPLLLASPWGWDCADEDCDYTQNWAHSWMVDGSWRETFGFPLKVDERLRPGLVVAAGENVGAIDLDAGVIAVVEPDDGARQYSAAVNAPLSDATIAALNDALASGDPARYRKVRRRPAEDAGSADE